MNTKKPKSIGGALPEHESGVRKLMAEAKGTPYEALPSLTEAKKVVDASLVMEGDYGGQIYVIAPIELVRCAEAVLQSLLLEIDTMEWNDPEGASVFFERAPIGSAVPGGMGGGRVLPNVWVHERLEPYRAAIVAVLSGEQESIRLLAPRMPTKVEHVPDAIEIVIASDVDYDRLVAEIYINGKFAGLLSQEKGPGHLMFEHFKGVTAHNATYSVPASTLVKAIEMAAKQLTET